MEVRNMDYLKCVYIIKMICKSNYITGITHIWYYLLTMSSIPYVYQFPNPTFITAAFCPPPHVYHDCFQRQCEPNCYSMRDRHQCPTMPGICIPGCFCPDGLVRKEDKCVKPNECRDCEYCT